MGSLAYSHANAYRTNFLTNWFLPFSSPGVSKSSLAMPPPFSMSLSSSESSSAGTWTRCLWVPRGGSSSDCSSPSSDSSATYSNEINNGKISDVAESGSDFSYNGTFSWRSRHSRSLWCFRKLVIIFREMSALLMGKRVDRDLLPKASSGVYSMRRKSVSTSSSFRDHATGRDFSG